ncbi:MULTISPECIES: hypothetical protein [Gloeobacter]|uniref:Gsr4429 protein n=2 Tax=Gloeobacter TaxID=33071 RepID=Q7ND07_GLOVI|nr:MULTISPECIES: hypothetical protein [Gloeobacter]UFP96839.1 hypothetical protein ISF26_11790 [Gloeobacter morelensis MG652769]BAC92370.1 gsr4429 [Gloeobacter violaceus PCC 7421]
MNIKAYALLGISCVTAIAAVGSVFELASGVPRLGTATTAIILAVTGIATPIVFWLAIKEGRAAL